MVERNLAKVEVAGSNPVSRSKYLLLNKNHFLVVAQLTITDFSLYTYTHVADEGGFELAEYPNI